MCFEIENGQKTTTTTTNKQTNKQKKKHISMRIPGE